jgi:type II restriction/modification system DNA methylase subunit YeeA
MPLLLEKKAIFYYLICLVYYFRQKDSNKKDNFKIEIRNLIPENMVENSLGKLWMLNHPNSSLKNSMKYYIDEDTPTTTFLKISTPQELTLIDPCCGSGHVLTYAFDLLTLIYEEERYSKNEIPNLLIEKIGLKNSRIFYDKKIYIFNKGKYKLIKEKGKI